MAELGDRGERQAGARSHRTAQAAVSAVAGRFVQRDLRQRCAMGYTGGSSLYFKKTTLSVMWCMVSSVSKREAAE